tara:strand:+ start:3897 stop:4079 length:183 start_codon:yes stop_codon:yes gene_type:complete
MSELEQLQKDVADAEEAYCRAAGMLRASDLYHAKYLAVKLAKKALRGYLKGGLGCCLKPF